MLFKVILVCVVAVVSSGAAEVVSEFVAISGVVRNPNENKKGELDLDDLKKYLIKRDVDTSNIFALGLNESGFIMIVNNKLVVFEGRPSHKLLIALAEYRTDKCVLDKLVYTKMTKNSNYQVLKDK